MARYSAQEQSSYESTGGSGFRIQKDGDKVKVVFLYAGPETIDGWAVHRFFGKKGFTYNVDCLRGPRDPKDKCPMCAKDEPLSTRLFVKMLILSTNEIVVWDRASSFRKELLGFMEYFNPLYSKVYEITRRGTGLNTSYQFQSLQDSGITPEQFEEFSQRADKVAEEFVRPADQYIQVLGYVEQARREEAEGEVQVQNSSQNAWSVPPQGAWGMPPQTQGWNGPQGQAPNGWGAPPQAPQGQTQGWGNPPVNQAPVNPAPPQAQPPQNHQQPAQPPQAAPAPTDQSQAAPTSWGAPPTGNWGTPPAGWNNGNQ